MRKGVSGKLSKFKVTAFLHRAHRDQVAHPRGDEWVNKIQPLVATVCWVRLLSRLIEAWMWYHRVVGKNRFPSWTLGGRRKPAACSSPPCPVRTLLKHGRAQAVLRRRPVVLRDDGLECGPNEGGGCVSRNRGGIMRTTWGDHDRFIDTYFAMFKISISPATVAAWMRMATTG